MKIYDEGIFLSHLDIEIAKSERFGYPFTLCVIKSINPQKYAIALLSSVLESGYRASDLVSRAEDDSFVIILNGTTEENAVHFVNRMTNRAVIENGIPIVTAITGYRPGDTRKGILDRLFEKI